MDIEALVRANASFYAAFSRRDFAALEQIWAAEHPVLCGHPGWPLIEGRAQVLTSFQAIIQSPNAPEVSCQDCRAMQGGGLGCVVCTEIVNGQRLLATNLFVLEEGHWRLIHHHASPMGAPRTPPPKSDGWVN